MSPEARAQHSAIDLQSCGPINGLMTISIFLYSYYFYIMFYMNVRATWLARYDVTKSILSRVNTVQYRRIQSHSMVGKSHHIYNKIGATDWTAKESMWALCHGTDSNTNWVIFESTRETRKSLIHINIIYVVPFRVRVRWRVNLLVGHVEDSWLCNRDSATNKPRSNIKHITS